MRLRVERVKLVGTSREVPLTPGLNIVSGPVGTGKTNFLRLVHGLLGGSFGSLAPEVRKNVPFIAGTLRVGDVEYEVIRPLRGEDSGRVEISGSDGTTLRVPVNQPDPATGLSYSAWMLGKLGLPHVKVPTAPTRPDSSPSSLSVSDFLLYSYLRQTDLDSGIMGSQDNFRNIKRRYVYEVLYGIRDSRQSDLEADLREVTHRIRLLTDNRAAFDVILEKTPWENRAELERVLREARNRLGTLQASIGEQVSGMPPDAETIRSQVLAADQRIADLQDQVGKERRSEDRLQGLVRQLESQSSRLIRAIVAKESLVGFEFLLCPRCGSNLPHNKHGPGHCPLCGQEEPEAIDDGRLRAEQDRIENQIEETRQLIAVHQTRQAALEEQLVQVRQQRAEKARILEIAVQSYVSDRAAVIAREAAERAGLEAEVHRVTDYLQLYNRRDEAERSLASLEARRDELQQALGDLSYRRDRTEELVKHLEAEFAAIIDRFKVPKPATPGETRIDRDDCMPLAYGQKFSELSQGTKVLVHVAYALAHHKTAIRHQIPLPGILIIDGLTDNIGKEGLDLERVQLMYRELVAISEELDDQLQILVGDHTGLPGFVEQYSRLPLSDEKKLVPL